MKSGVSLERALSKLGYASRTVARELILSGRVSVNTKIITNPSYRVDLKKDKIAVDGKILTRKPKIYIVLNKPKGVVTTRKDELNRKTIYDIVNIKEWIAPAGRLDKDTSGLLILTNDNKFADFITNPESKVSKTYLVKINKRIKLEDLQKIQSGMDIEIDGQTYKTMPAKAKVVKMNPKTCWIEIEIHEGKNRQVRKMFEKLGYKVENLIRTKIGNFTDINLKPGEWRFLNQEELKQIAPGYFK
ncbi:MAG: rRNA pseudouridine synthase [Candidatus Kryptonium sp.]|nr:rRNA pseudouridine synthase [Candidatus Kryptonium sp.]MCX7761578.1 rRNA pseudouridine synthase [Candidatus Kryptonium sp.]